MIERYGSPWLEFRAYVAERLMCLALRVHFRAAFRYAELLAQLRRTSEGGDDPVTREMVDVATAWGWKMQIFRGDTQAQRLAVDGMLRRALDARHRHTPE